MRRSGFVVGATVVALLVAVVSVRDVTAADDADLAVGLGEPSPEPSEDAPAPGPVVLGANGLPGLRLGAESHHSTDYVEETPSGCRLVWDEAGGTSGSDVRQDQVTWETSGWVVDGNIVSVFVGTWSDASSPTALLQTWLGPTLGSPIEAAEEMPGATTVTERPFGPTGPVVHVVTVPGRGVEVVYSDLPPFGGSDPSGAGAGRISTMEVRKPAGRDCAVADLDLRPPGDERPAGLVVDVDGVGPLRLGAPVAALVDAEGVVEDGSGDGFASDVGGIITCQSFVLQGGPDARGFVRAVAHDGVLTEVQVWDPGLSTSFGLPAGAEADDVRELFPDTTERSDPVMGMGVVVVEVDGITVELQMQPATVWLPDLERPVEGGVPTVGGVVLRTPGTPQHAC